VSEPLDHRGDRSGRDQEPLARSPGCNALRVLDLLVEGRGPYPHPSFAKKIFILRRSAPLPLRVILSALCLSPSALSARTRTARKKMKHRDIEYSVVQGLGRNVWKWSVALDADHRAAGQAMTKADAVSQAERAIDRALAARKVRLVPSREQTHDDG
jgi:hypothetical protein